MGSLVTVPASLALNDKQSDAEVGRRLKEAKKAWREKNKEKLREYMRAWKEKNPERRAAHRYSNKKKARTRELVDLMARQRGVCALCGGQLAAGRHLDHKVPVSRGGVSSIENYQWLCVDCNTGKGAKTNDEFVSHIRKILAFLA